jgi:hypothetical protein
MTSQRVAELVRRAAADTGVLQALRNDPGKLRPVLKLTNAHVDALQSAEAFPPPKVLSNTKKPVAPRSLAAEGTARARRDAAVVVRQATGGSLLPPEGSGEFTGATGGFTPPSTFPPGLRPPPPAPGVRPPSPPVVPPPGIRPPSVKPPRPPAPGAPPHQPPARPPMPPFPPTKPPVAPPIFPPPFQFPPTPQWPGPPEQQPPSPADAGQPSAMPPPAMQGCHCHCCAIVAIVSVTATTAITAITALAGITAQSCGRATGR